MTDDTAKQYKELLNALMRNNPITQAEVDTIRVRVQRQREDAHKILDKIGLTELLDQLGTRTPEIVEATIVHLATAVMKARLDCIYVEGLLEGDLDGVVNVFGNNLVSYYLTEQGLKKAPTLNQYIDQQVEVWRILHEA